MATAMCHSSASTPQKGIRFCATCLAVYRQDFARCPLDGGTLVVGANDPWIGLTVGSHYVIDALIGEGAMGRVYRAHHRQFSDRRYAIKILIGDLAASAQHRARFALEAEHARRLAHPNVVGVIDFGSTERGIDHMVMELVEGQTLGQILRQGPMDPERVIQLARQIAEGLDHAHGRGMIHRDLKPENVLIVSDRDHEIARIADFGLSLSKHNERRLTTTGVVCTPAYAAPEQLRGGDIDHRVDLYALGVSMFEMLSGGILPFEGDVDASVTRKLSNDAPSVHLVAPNVPPALVAIVGRLLSPEPSRRPRSARAVIRALDQALSAPRVEMKTDQTAPLRAQALSSDPAAVPPEAETYTSATVERMMPARSKRRAVVQLAACAITLSGVLAWADLEGLMSPRADASVQPRYPVAAQLATAAPATHAPRTLLHTLAAVPRRLPMFATPVSVVIEPAVTIPRALALAPDHSVGVQPAALHADAVTSATAAIAIDIAKVMTSTATEQRADADDRPTRAEPERATRRVKARRIVRARRAEPRQEDDVVDKILDAAVAKKQAAPASEPPAATASQPPVETTIEVPGPTPTPAVATPPADPALDAYDEAFPGEQP